MTFWRMPDSVRLRNRVVMWSELNGESGIFPAKICLLNPRCIFVLRRKIICRPVLRVKWWRWYTAIRAVNRFSAAATARCSYRRRFRGGWSATIKFMNSAACRILLAASLSMVCMTATHFSAMRTIWLVLICLIFIARKTGGIRVKIFTWTIWPRTDFTR